MKDLIVIIGTIILGGIIFNMMVGDGENSLKTAITEAIVNTCKMIEG